MLQYFFLKKSLVYINTLLLLHPIKSTVIPLYPIHFQVYPVDLEKKKAAFQIDVFKLGFKSPHLYFAIISHTSPTIWRITPASRSVLYR